MTTNTITTRGSLLTFLRAVIPHRPLRFSEALRIAELQACRLLELAEVSDGPVPSDIIAEAASVQIEYRDLPTSGMSYWNGHAWVICLNAHESHTRQRFTLLHEFKHIIDHGRSAALYRGDRYRSYEAQAEQAADYFAACALMPKRLIKRAWGEGIQRLSELADLFDVSLQAMDIRLTQLGLIAPRVRCAPSTRTAQGVT
jgi:Zn-dependent peptidase ImmA (M78 family)